MNALRLVVLHYVFLMRQLVRMPGYVIPTIGFPILFYAFFGLPNSSNPFISRMIMASFCAFAVIGIAIFQFGVGIANERGTPWERYLRTLDVGPATRFAARELVVLTFSCITTALIVACAVAFGHARPTIDELLLMIAALFVGTIPMTLLGVLIGYWTSARSAIPIANLVYLPLSFAGGLWIPPAYMPALLARISPFTPVRGYADVVWSGALGSALPPNALPVLAGYTVLFAIVALVGYRRDESRRYA
jgi:ABC-2 type transport system permease protein